MLETANRARTLSQGRIGDDEAAAGGASFFYAPHKNAVVEWGKFYSHTCRLLSFESG